MFSPLLIDKALNLYSHYLQSVFLVLLNLGCQEMKSSKLSVNLSKDQYYFFNYLNIVSIFLKLSVSFLLQKG